jgi:hypothetical protein
LVRLGLIVATILLVGLATGLAVDTGLGTRPFATLLLSVAAAQIAALLVYRAVSASLERVAEKGERGQG